MVTTDQEDDSLFIPEALECTISEGASAERMRRKRARDKASQSDGKVTEGDTYKDKNKVREEKELDNTLFNSLTLKEGNASPPSAGAGGEHPSLIDCQECADEGKVNLSEDGIKAFYNRMVKDGWKIKGKPVENLLKAMRGFAKNHKRYQKEESQPEPELDEPEYEEQKEIEGQDRIEHSIYQVARKYISKKLFDENVGGHHVLIGTYCPKESFTEEQLEYMQEYWCVWPKTGNFVKVDPNMESGSIDAGI